MYLEIFRDIDLVRFSEAVIILIVKEKNFNLVRFFK